MGTVLVNKTLFPALADIRHYKYGVKKHCGVTPPPNGGFTTLFFLRLSCLIEL